MLRLALHLLLIAGLLLNAVAPASAHTHGAAAMSDSISEGLQRVVAMHGQGRHASPEDEAQTHGGAHAHHTAHAVADTLAADHHAAHSPASTAEDGSASHGTCGGAGCACGCVLPPALALPLSISAMAPRAAPLLVHVPVPALAAHTTPPFRPPAAIALLIA